MSIENFKRQLDTKELQSYGKHSPFREMLEQLIDTLVRLDREAYVGVGNDHRVSDVSGYRNGYNPTSVTHASGSLNSMASQVSSSADTPLYPNIINRGQRSSEALLNVATECYIEGVSSPVRHISNFECLQALANFDRK